MTFKTHHVAFTVQDIEESIKWYVDKLGFSLLDRYDKDDVRIARIYLSDVTIELFHYKKNLHPLPDNRKDLYKDLHVIGTKHLCIEIEDLNKTLQELKQKRVEIIGETDTAYFGGKFVFIKDCNEILIELYQK